MKRTLKMLLLPFILVLGILYMTKFIPWEREQHDN
jgi:hypothetical protein